MLRIPATLLLFLGLAACSAKLSPKTRSGPAAAAGGSVSVPATTAVQPEPPAATAPAFLPNQAAAGARTQFQTRNTATVALAPDLLDGAIAWSAQNQAQSEPVIAESPLDAPEGVLRGTTLSLFPHGEWRGKLLGYGANTLRLTFAGNTSAQYTDAVVTHRDFPLFGAGIVAGGGNGWMHAVSSRPAVAPGGGTLTSGWQGIVNH
jgi:hypothetical protein